MHKRLVALVSASICAALILIDIPILVPVKAMVINVSPIGEGRRVSVIQKVCQRAYIGDRRGSVDCVEAFTRQADREVATAHRRAMRERQTVCKQLDEFFRAHVDNKYCNEEACRFWPSIYPELQSDMEWLSSDKRVAHVLYDRKDSKHIVAWDSPIGLKDGGTIDCSAEKLSE